MVKAVAADAIAMVVLDAVVRAKAEGGNKPQERVVGRQRLVPTPPKLKRKMKPRSSTAPHGGNSHVCHC